MMYVVNVKSSHSEMGNLKISASVSRHQHRIGIAKILFLPYEFFFFLKARIFMSNFEN